MHHRSEHPSPPTWPYELIVQQGALRDRTLEIEFLDPVTVYEFKFGKP